MELGDGEVRIAVEATAFGPRDLQISLAARAGAERGDPGEGPEPARGGGVVGRVTETGSAASEWLERRVVVPRLIACGECHFCRRGAPQGCPGRRELGATRDGGLAGEIVALGRWLSPADGELEVAAPGAAVLGDDALLVYTHFCRAGVAPGEPVVVIGDGPRSALIADIAAVKGARVARVGDPLELDTVGDADGFAGRPWRLFALDRHEGFLQWAPVPAGSTVAVVAGGAFPIAASATVLTGELGHPDLLPELVALAAGGHLELDRVATWCDAAEIETRAADIMASGRIPVAR